MKQNIDNVIIFWFLVSDRNTFLKITQLCAVRSHKNFEKYFSDWIQNDIPVITIRLFGR